MRCFTFAEIASGQVPRRESFGQVATIIRKISADSPYIELAIIYGSVLAERVTPASDLDVAICLRAGLSNSSREAALHEVKSMSDYAHLLHIPLNPSLVDIDRLAHGLHNWGPGYTQHLLYSAKIGGIIKGNLDALLRINGDRSREAIEYLRAKLRKVEGILVRPTRLQGDAVWYDLLSDVLSIGKHIARRIADIDNFQDDGPIPLDEFFLGLPYSSSIKEDYLTLKALSQKYLAALNEQLIQPNEPKWEAMIQEIEQGAWILERFLYRMGMILSAEAAT